MAFGLGHLRLAPRSFWAMTPRELASALRGSGGAAAPAPSGADLHRLMRQFPDGANDG